MQIFNGFDGLLCLFVGSNSHSGLAVEIYRIKWPFATVSTCRHVCPEGFNLCFNLVHINIADYDNRLIVRTIPFVVISTECIILKIIDNRCITNDIAFAVLGVRIKFCANDVAHTTSGIVTSAPFFANHTTLCINLFRQKEQAASPIVHHQQRRVNDSLADGRHVRQTINGLVNRRVCVDISAEIHTDRLEIIDDTFARKMLRTIESHVLQEVRQTILVILFQHSTYGLCDVEIAALFWLLVVTDVIR